jgi:hypothetical protein
MVTYNIHIKRHNHRQALWHLVTRAWFSDSTAEPMLQQRWILPDHSCWR